MFSEVMASKMTQYFKFINIAGRAYHDVTDVILSIKHVENASTTQPLVHVHMAQAHLKISVA